MHMEMMHVEKKKKKNLATSSTCGSCVSLNDHTVVLFLRLYVYIYYYIILNIREPGNRMF